MPSTWLFAGFGRIESTLFTLDWLLDKDLRQGVTVGLNKGEIKNSLAKADCFNRLGELRDRSFEAQRHRASGPQPGRGEDTKRNFTHAKRQSSSETTHVVQATIGHLR
jgi:hypothetical protein